MDFLKKAMGNPAVTNALGGKTGSSSSQQQPGHGQPSQPKKEGEYPPSTTQIRTPKLTTRSQITLTKVSRMERYLPGFERLY